MKYLAAFFSVMVLLFTSAMVCAGEWLTDTIGNDSKFRILVAFGLFYSAILIFKTSLKFRMEKPLMSLGLFMVCIPIAVIATLVLVRPESLSSINDIAYELFASLMAIGPILFLVGLYWPTKRIIAARRAALYDQR